MQNLTIAMIQSSAIQHDQCSGNLVGDHVDQSLIKWMRCGMGLLLELAIELFLAKSAFVLLEEKEFQRNPLSSSLTFRDDRGCGFYKANYYEETSRAFIGWSIMGKNNWQTSIIYNYFILFYFPLTISKYYLLVCMYVLCWVELKARQL